MTVNIISESFFLPELWGGIHSACLMNISMLKNKGVEVIVNSSKKADIVHLHTTGPFGLLKLISSKQVVITSHITSESFLDSWKGAKIFQPIISRYLNFFYKKADLVIALNEEVKKDMQKIRNNKPVISISNPIDSSLFFFDKNKREAMRIKYGIGENTFVVLGVGKFIPRKGFYDFMEIAANLPDVTFIWVGGYDIQVLTPQTEKQKELLNNKPKNVLLPGIFPYTSMPDFYSMADVLLFPSYQEIAPMVIIEAAACGLPVIARNNDEYKGLYSNLYIPGDHIEDFIFIIKKLKNDAKYYKDMKKKSEELVEKYSFDAISRKLINSYNQLI